MTIYDFISSRSLTPFGSPPSGVRPGFAPSSLFKSFEATEAVEVFRDPSGTLWVALAPSLNRFNIYQEDVLTFTGAINTPYREIVGIKAGGQRG